MNVNVNDLQNPNLRNIVTTLFPPKSEGSVTTLIPPSSSSSTGSTNALNSDSPSSEFIPYIYYALFQILKGQNTSTNQLETKTGFIRHRLRSCKDLIKGNDVIISLLCKSTNEWRTIIRNRENELQVKRNVLQQLGERIDDLIGRESVKAEEEEEEEGKKKDVGEDPEVVDSKDGKNMEDDISFGVATGSQDPKLEDNSQINLDAAIRGSSLDHNTDNTFERNTGLDDRVGSNDNNNNNNNNEERTENKTDFSNEDAEGRTSDEKDFEMELN